MKKIKSLAEASETIYSDNYLVRISPYQLYLIKKALDCYFEEIDYNITNYEWEDTEENKQKLNLIFELIKEIEEIPF